MWQVRRPTAWYPAVKVTWAVEVKPCTWIWTETTTPHQRPLWVTVDHRWVISQSVPWGTVNLKCKKFFRICQFILYARNLLLNWPPTQLYLVFRLLFGEWGGPSLYFANPKIWKNCDHSYFLCPSWLFISNATNRFTC